MDIENINAGMPGWAAEAIAAIERFMSRFESPLAERATRLHTRFSRKNGATSLAGALTAASATPILALMEALRSDYGIPADDSRLEKIAVGTLLLYFHVRIQDDIIDEPETFDRSYVYLMQTFCHSCQRVFADALDGNPAFFQFQEKIMGDFAETALWEVDKIWDLTMAVPDMERIGEKFLPMAVPLGALALLAKRNPDLIPLTRFVKSLGTGLQFVNDILNIREDHRSQRLTPVLRWLYESQRLTPGGMPENIRLLLITDASLQHALQQAIQSIKAAEEIATASDLPYLAAVARNRAEYVKSIPYRLFSLHLGRPEL